LKNDVSDTVRNLGREYTAEVCSVMSNEEMEVLTFQVVKVTPWNIRLLRNSGALDFDC
jgi:hypothetical protein